MGGRWRAVSRGCRSLRSSRVSSTSTSPLRPLALSCLSLCVPGLPGPCLGGSPITTHRAAYQAHVSPDRSPEKRMKSWLGSACRSLQGLKAASSGGGWLGSGLPPSELSRPPPDPPPASEPGAAALCGRSSPDRNCWVTLNFLNSELLALGDITAWVSDFSASSGAPLPRLLSPQCFAEFLRLLFSPLLLKAALGTLYNLGLIL